MVEREEQLAAAHHVFAELSLTPDPDQPLLRPISDKSTSIPFACTGPQGQPYVLKFFVTPAESRFYPKEVRLSDYPRREAAFLRFLDSVDPNRTQVAAPVTVAMDHQDPPQWMLLKRVEGSVPGDQADLAPMEIHKLLHDMQQVNLERLMGRRDFPLNHWETVSYLDRVRMMYDPVVSVMGQRRWSRTLDFFTEALRWTETRKSVLVHGDCTEHNLLVTPSGRPMLLDFERVGIGNEDHDLAWMWIQSLREPGWKRELISRWFGNRVGSDRIRAEWGIRAALVYLACRRLRYGYLSEGAEDPFQARDLALLDAAIVGGGELFPS